jgi:mycofactocin system glycosyltransferase
MMRVVRDPSWRDVDDETVLAGSPLRLLRLTAGGRAVLARAEASGLDAPTATQSRFLDRLITAGAVHPVEPGPSAFSAADVTVVMPVRGPWPTIPRGCRVIVVDDASEPPLVAPPHPDDARQHASRTTPVGHAAADTTDGMTHGTTHGTPVGITHGTSDDHPADTAGDAGSETSGHPGVEVLRLDVNVGPGGARSAGLERVTTPLVAFVDADVDLPDDWLAGLLGHFTDPQVAAVAPRIASRPGPTTLEQYETSHSPLDLGDTPALVAAGSRVSYVPTAVLVARTDAVRACGGFDTAMRFGEDVDLVWRLGAAGWRVRYEPSVVAVHRPRDSWPGWLHQRVGYGTAAAPLGIRHGEAVAPMRCSGWSLAVWTLALTGRRAGVAGALVVAATTGVLLQRRLSRLPAREAWRLVARGHLLAGLQLARAVRRVWWPLAIIATLVGGRRARTMVALAVLAPSVVSSADRRQDGPSRLARDAALGVVDDAAYGWGVWKGVLRERSLQALRPSLSAWPPRDAG